MFLGAQMLSGNAAPAEPEAAGSVRSGDKDKDPAQNYYASAEQTVIRRDSSGQFYLNAEVNGQSGRFLVDTGADVLALTVDDAMEFGIDVEPSTFQPITQTASGPGHGVAVTVDRLVVAGKELENVRAIVVDGLETNLLGQSVLRQLGRIELHGNQMVINKS
jgi:aspartyl protease family protein